MIEISNNNKDVAYITLDKIKIAIADKVSKSFVNEVTLEMFENHLTQYFTYYLRAYIAGNTIHKEETKIYIPKTWFDALKKAIGIKRYNTKEILVSTVFTHVCPHLNLPSNGDSHITFLMSNHQLNSLEKTWD